MKIRPYGDTLSDGKVQSSFTLPCKADEAGLEAAKQFAKQMGYLDPNIVHAEEIGEGFSFFVVYGSVPYLVETDDIKVEKIETPTLSRGEIEELIENEIGRDVIFIGASTGTDAHTVGIDAIMNMGGLPDITDSSDTNTSKPITWEVRCQTKNLSVRLNCCMPMCSW